MQDAVINVGKLFGYELKDDLYKEVPPQISIDTDFHKVKKAVCIKNFLIFNKVPIDGSVRLDGKPFKEDQNGMSSPKYGNMAENISSLLKLQIKILE